MSIEVDFGPDKELNSLERIRAAAPAYFRANAEMYEQHRALYDRYPGFFDAIRRTGQLIKDFYSTNDALRILAVEYERGKDYLNDKVQAGEAHRHRMTSGWVYALGDLARYFNGEWDHPPSPHQRIIYIYTRADLPEKERSPVFVSSKGYVLNLEALEPQWERADDWEGFLQTYDAKDIVPLRWESVGPEHAWFPPV